MKIDTNELLRNFVDIKNIANLNLLTCYDVLFNKNGIIYNIGSFVIIFIIIIHLICFFGFYYKYLNQIKQKIKDIIFGIRNYNSNPTEEKEARKKTIKKKKIKNNGKQIKKKKRKRRKNLKILENNFNSIIIQKKSVNSKMKLSGDSMVTKNQSQDKEITKKAKLIMQYNDQELNDLLYELALKSDKRTFSEYYISLLKTKHILIFSFCYNNDYNSRLIKIDIFFISFTISFALNTLFFDDKTMHTIYIDEGKYKIINQLPQIIYSFMISSVLNALLKLLGLLEGDIIKFKRDKNQDNLDANESVLIGKIIRKSLLFFIISLLLLLFCWYYVSMFCAVYKNTQIHLIKDTLISFAFSLIYPIFINLIPGMLRIPALSGEKNNKKYLYNLSKYIQLI